MKNQRGLKAICLLMAISSCSKEPYEPKAYTAKGTVIGVEKCSVDDNYNFWLIDLSVENNSPEKEIRSHIKALFIIMFLKQSILTVL